jgi:hypothetical protein
MGHVSLSVFTLELIPEHQYEVNKEKSNYQGKAKTGHFHYFLEMHLTLSLLKVKKYRCVSSTNRGKLQGGVFWLGKFSEKVSIK